MDDEIREGSHAIFVWGISFVLVVIVGLFIYYSALPSLRNLETQGTRSSYQYIQTKQALLLKLQADYTRLDAEIATQTDPAIIAAKHTQQQAIVTRMRAEAQLLNRADIPRDVARFLQEHNEL